MVAGPGADRREGVGLTDHPIRLLVLAALDVGDIAPCLGPHRTRRLARGPDQVLADKGVAPLVDDVSLVLVAEVAQGAEDRIGGGLTQAAHGGVLDDDGQLFEQLQVIEGAAAFGDVLQNLVHPLGALAAGVALAARLILEKGHEVLGHVDHAGVFVHDDHPAGAHDRTGLLEAVVVDGEIESGGRNAPSRGTSGLYGLDLRLAGGAAADIVDHLSDGHAEGNLDEPGVADLADQREDLRAGVPRGADLGVLGPAAIDDHADVGEGLDVVDAGRETVDASGDGEGRSLSRLAHESFDRADEGGLLAADEGPRPANDLDVEIDSRFRGCRRRGDRVRGPV